jgi:signal transduction histidine kinase
VPSRDNKARRAAQAASSPASASQAAGRAAGGTSPEDTGQGQAPRATKTSRRSLKNWRVRSRLLLLIIIPTLTAVVLGGSRIVTSVQSALGYQRVEQLANMSYDVTGLAARLEDERDQTLEYIGEGTAGRPGTLSHNTADGAPQNLQLVTQDQSLTAPWIRKVQSDAAAIGAGYPTQVQTDAQNIGDLLKLLAPLRSAATTTQLPATQVLAQYASMTDELLAIDDNIALDSGDPALNNDVRALNLVSLIAEEASEQRGLLAYAFAQEGPFNPQVLSDVTTALEEQNANIAEYNRVATPQQVALYNSSVAGSLVDFASSYELQAIQYGEDGKALNLAPTTANEWVGAMSTGTIGRIDTVQQQLVATTIARASVLRRQSIETASVVGAAVLIVLLLSLLLTTVVGRSMVRPLRRLRSGALEVAGVRLPETVRRMSDSDGAGVPLEVEPIDVDSSDEIGEVARAFDQVHREALRLAANEAALRGNVNAMFVNLSRRSQSLVERQIRLIDDLEQGEQDPDRLSSLFQMDHLATRMRRNSENLLVLAGHDATRRWNQPVALVDVLRAAVSEIEQYERVTLNVQPGIAVRGHAVNDVVHLLAELAENATSFSSAETPVVVSGHLLSSGGVLLDITDQGVGMGAEEMAHANWRLDNPPVVDVAVSRRMGLFVVARLAARHGIRVRLRPAAAGGLTALVWLPDEVVSHEADTGGPGMRRFDVSAPGAGFAGAAAGGASHPGGASGFNLALSGNGDGQTSPAEQEINAARAPRFGSQTEDASEPGSGLGPRRVPGAGLHPGNVGWGGAATTSPLPAVGSEAAEADLAEAGRAEAMSGSYAAFDGFGSGPMPVADLAGPTVEFSAAPSSAPSVDLSQPSVVGSPRGAGRGDDVADSDRVGFGWDTGLGSNGGQSSLDGPLGTAAATSSPSGVVVPPAEHVATENRLPIFEAVESDWFRRGRSGVAAAAVGLAGAGGSGAGTVIAGGANLGSAVDDGASWPSQPGTGDVPEPEVTWAASAADQGWEAAAAVSSPATGGTTSAGLPKRVPQANLVPGTASPEPIAAVPARSAAATRDRFASFQRGIREGRAAIASDDADSDEGDGSR